MIIQAPHIFNRADDAYREWLAAIYYTGNEVSPRGQRTLELQHLSAAFALDRPVIRNPVRKVNFKFMAAEPLWYLSGSDDVEDIAQYNSQLRAFSDDGSTFFGAYGPRINQQLPYVLNKLQADPATRQAAMTLWRPNPPETRDVPCTVALTFEIRHGKLNCHVFMRSSDAWLGVPYDWFSFSVIAAFVASAIKVPLGTLYFTAASAHLYARDIDSAREAMRWSLNDRALEEGEPLSPLTAAGNWGDIYHSLVSCRGGAFDAHVKWRIR